MDRLERLLNLVAAFIDTERPLTADEIRRRVPGYPEEAGPTFHRAFERDKAALRDMGIPIDVVDIEPDNPESEQGYRIRRERYELADPGLTPDEVAALHLAATHVRLEGGDATAAVWKLGGVPGDAGGMLDGVTTASIPGSDHLPGLFGATAERRPVTFGYRGERRTIDPWRLEFRNGAWYVIGRDHARDGRRTFRVDRIEAPLAPGAAGSFDPPERTDPVSTRPWEMGDEEPVDVEVLVDPDQAEWAVANAGPPAAVGPDGSAHLTLRVTNRGALRSWVLGFLDHAEVLGPPAEREAMRAWLSALAGR
ncbi:MAG TPA: WYL domain-containing protein [Acidimicrobiales bacterium]